MRHYEIVIMVHPDQSEQAEGIVKRYCQQIEQDQGHIHRFEDWGRRVLAYPINKVHKAHYILLNIECSLETLQALKQAFRFNDAIIRQLIIKKNGPVSVPSPMMEEKAKGPEKSDKAA